MTVLAEIGNALGQEFVVPAAMGCVADQAIFLDWVMFSDKRPPFIGMTAVAELIDVVGFEHVLGQGAVRVMAITAAHLAFNDGMMGLFVDLGADVSMAAVAGFWLCDDVPRHVDGMAVGAGNIVLLVCAHIPHGQIGR